MPELRPDRRRLAALALTLLPLAALWAARYWHSPRFGLYEDDLTIVPHVVEMSGGEVLRFVGEYIAGLRGHARPLSDSLIYLLSFAGWRLGGLWPMYLIGFAIQALNLALFTQLLRRLMPGAGFALAGGLAYALFAADTTQAFLTHSLGVHPSLTLVLVAAHAWLSGWRAMPAALGAVLLFAYESPFPLLFALPLLEPRWDRAWLRRALAHGAALALLLAAVAALRSAVGEQRVTDLGLAAAVLTPLKHMLQGPLVSLGTYAYRPLQALQALNLEAALAAGLAWPVFALALDRAGLGATDAAGGAAPGWRLLRLALAGLALLALAYALTFTTRAFAISGRETRVHLAAAPGAALVVAVAVEAAALWLGARWGRALPAALGLCFAGLMAFGFVVQRDYVRAWELQQSFWRELLPLIPDVDEGVIVLVEPEGLEDTRQIGANTWNLPRVLETLYGLPAAWEAPPRVVRLIPGWQDRIVAHDFQFRTDAGTVIAPASLDIFVPMRRTIFIMTGAGRLERWQGTITLEDEAFELWPQGPPVLTGLPRTAFYDVLLGPPGGQP